MNTATAHESTPSTLTVSTTGSDLDRYRAILEAKIQQARGHAVHVLEQIEQDQPRDQIVRPSAVLFDPDRAAGVTVRVGEDAYVPTDFALGQIASRAGIPIAYLRELTSPQAPTWQPHLAAHILRSHHEHADGERVLVRSVRGQLRGWLSNRYRRLDSRPLVDALATEAASIGALPVDAVATETRVVLKLVLPRIFEPIPGELLVYGGEWSNSDYGNGVHAFRPFALRVICLNGMTRESALKQVHLGTRLNDDLELSDRTRRLDTETSASILRDVVRTTFERGPDALTRAIRAAHERPMTATQLERGTRALAKNVQKSIVEAFESKDVLNLPPGNTAWRASNAISWIARNTDNPEHRMDLEVAAGALV
jgi:hypothetical protein